MALRTPTMGLLTRGPRLAQLRPHLPFLRALPPYSSSSTSALYSSQPKPTSPTSPTPATTNNINNNDSSSNSSSNSGSSSSPKATPPPRPTALSAAASGRRAQALNLQAEVDTTGFVPRPLGPPIGLSEDPLAALRLQAAGGGEKRKSTILSYNENLARRKEITEQLWRPYFQDLSNLKYHGGKTFLANPRLFRPDAAKYFPNFTGTTLAHRQLGLGLVSAATAAAAAAAAASAATAAPISTHTAERMEGKVCLVAFVPNLWAQNQVDSFISEQANPALSQMLAHSSTTTSSSSPRSGPAAAEKKAELIEIAVEQSSIRALLQRSFFSRMRKERQPEAYGNYFLVRGEVSGRVREAIGLMNMKVGYIYLVDQNGKIRWAASAAADEEERGYLVSGLRKLLDEWSKSS